MKDQREISAIVQGVIAASKDLYVIKDSKGVWKGVPDYYEGYKDAVRQRDRILTHAEVDKYPENLFKKRAPNQTDEEAEYIKENYKNTTHPVFMDMLGVTGRGLSDNNWQITYPEDSAEGEDYKEYVEYGIDVFGSVENYVKRIVHPLKEKDANGVMTFTINPPKTKEVDGEMVVVDNERFEPQPKYYSCDRVVAWKWNEYALFESHERSTVNYGNRPLKVGRVFYFYDDANIWKVEQSGDFRDNTFTYTLIFNHQLDMFPCHKMKGVPSMLESGEVYYTSRFYYAVDLLDWSLLYSNYLNASMANVCFPFRWMVGDECDFTDSHGTSCHEGKIAHDGIFTNCPRCDGSGMKVRTSPMKTYLLKSEKGQDKGDTSFPTPMGFVSPQTDTLEFTRKMADQYVQDSKSMLHIHTSNADVKGKEDITATVAAIDVKAMYAFVQPDSDETFDVFQFLLDVIGKVREGSEFEGAELQYPTTFDYRTDADILDDIRIARESNAPSHIISALIYQYISNRFYSDKATAKVSEIVMNADRLLTLTNAEVTERKAQGLVNGWEVVLHDSAFQLINELIGRSPDFLDTELDAQVAALTALAKEKAPKIDAISARDRLLNIGA